MGSRTIFFLTLFIGLRFSVGAQSHTADSLRYSYLKFNAPQFLYSAFRRYPSLYLIFHYESPLKAKSRFTYDLVLDYQSSYGSELTFTGAIDLRIRPQLRYYFSKGSICGVYAGIFPMYMYKGGKYTTDLGNYWGGGLTAGYQILVSKKIPFDFNLFYGKAWGKVTVQDYITGTSQQSMLSYYYSNIELNIGIPVRRRVKVK